MRCSAPLRRSECTPPEFQCVRSMLHWQLLTVQLCMTFQIACSIDTLLSGGLRDEQLIELAGPYSTGKTQERIAAGLGLSVCCACHSLKRCVQICLSIAASLVLKGQTVHWIDMTDGFSATRLHNIVQARMHVHKVWHVSALQAPLPSSPAIAVPVAGCCTERHDADAEGHTSSRCTAIVLLPPRAGERGPQAGSRHC